MSDSIRLSEKHGVNPAIPLCFFCLKPKNEIIFAGKMRGEYSDREAPQHAVWDMRPCDECKGFMAKGIILMSVDESKSADHKNPYRSGGWCVVKEDMVKRVLGKDKQLLEATLRKRIAFITDEAWDKIGLPRGEIKDEQSEPVPTDS
jgi:hypothetical protein